MKTKRFLRRLIGAGWGLQPRPKRFFNLIGAGRGLQPRPKRFFILLVLLFITACNGGDEDSSNIAGGGIGGTGISIGPISAFGSIFVNGIKFETDNTVITVNGQPKHESDLKVGMVVQIEGIIDSDSNTGNAARIDFNENVKGPIQSFDYNNNTLIVLGQTVIVEQLTVLDGIINLTDLNVGDIVNVSGLVDAEGIIRATWIARESDIGEFEIVGRVTNLTPATQTFAIGAITIDYSQVLRLDIPSGSLANGLLVEVKGIFKGTPIGEVLMATSVETQEELFNADVGTLFEIEGFIAQFKNSFDFKIAQLPVTTTSQTVFQFGSAEDLAFGVKVEVTGKLDANNVLVLEEISFRDVASKRTPAGRINIEADVEAIDVASQNLTLLGISIQANKFTQFRDRRDMTIPFGLLDLSIGDRVAMSGFLDLATNTLMAEILLRQPFRLDEQVVFSGPIANVDVDAGTFTILGITVVTDEDTVYEDEKSGGTEIIVSTEQFFANIQQLELLIEVQGVLTDNILLAKRLEIEY